MTAIIARLLLSMVVMLGAPVLYTIAYILIYDTLSPHNYNAALVWATVISGIYLTVSWLAVWYTTVRWTPKRIAWSMVGFLGSIVAAFLVGFMFTANWRVDEVAIICGGMVWALLWLAASTLIWRETKAERRQRQRVLGTDAIACPACGYNLTGLREAGCPECGAKYTLDQLFAEVMESKRDLAD